MRAATTTLFNFYPRPPRGGRRQGRCPDCQPLEFLSTPSARRATLSASYYYTFSKISIHALREEGDRSWASIIWFPLNFYPRPPRGGRPYMDCINTAGDFISIHALREEGDRVACCVCMVARLFLSTPSARRATPQRAAISDCWKYFYPRPPRGGRLSRWAVCPAQHDISIHALREEGDSKNRDKISIFKQIIQHSARI